jgi:hypothetical protein
MRVAAFFSTIVACALCAACTAGAPEQSGAQTGTVAPGTGTESSKTDSAAKANEPSPEEYTKCIEEIAASADDTIMDGWFFGQEARMLKSFYRKIPAAQKAEFAMAYHDWMSKSGEDMVSDFKSYVPYSKRADFAIDWWSKKVERFNTQEKKQQVLWAHESIQDAGELWWRANEKLNPASVDSPKTLAHDEEQKMVSKFMENEGSPGSISDQVWKRTH